jgi:hypothetical protein
MTYVMKHETWMDLTNAGRFKVRSAELKKIDAALLGYHARPGEATLAAVKLALHHWKMAKGYDGNGGKPAWVTSERNKRSAVSNLDMQVFKQPNPLAQSVLKELAELPFYGIEAWAEDDAREAMKLARTEALQDMFAGRELVIRKTSAALAGRTIKKLIGKAKQNANETAAAATKAATDAAKAAALSAAQRMFASQIAMAREIIEGILDDLPMEVVREVLALLDEIVPGFITELAGAIAPYVSVVRSGVKTTAYLVKTIKARYQFYDLGTHMGAMLPGDPEAAARALLTMVQREVAKNGKMTAIYGTDTALKGGALALDAASLGVPSVSAVMNPLSGMVTALAVLGVTVRALARDIQERQAANRLLKHAGTTRLTAQLFQESPLMGCWFLSCANTSDIINFLVSDIGEPGWNLDVEVMVAKHVRPITEAAKGFVADARFEVSGMSMAKGATASTTGTFDIKAKLKKKMITKVGEKLPFVDNQNYQTFAKAQGQETVSPDVFKSRIVGMGNG